METQISNLVGRISNFFKKDKRVPAAPVKPATQEAVLIMESLHANIANARSQFTERLMDSLSGVEESHDGTIMIEQSHKYGIKTRVMVNNHGLTTVFLSGENRKLVEEVGMLLIRLSKDVRHPILVNID